jgi:hypothetical protein
VIKKEYQMKFTFLKAASVFIALSLTNVANAGMIEYKNNVLADNAFLYYQFEENQGASLAVDSSAGGSNGSYIGNVNLGSTETGAAIGLGNSAMLDGSSYIDVPSLGVYSQLTIEMWVNLDEINGGCCTSLFSTDSWGSSGGSSLHFNIHNSSIQHVVNSNNGDVFSDPSAIQINTWHHIVSTYDSFSGQVQIFVDGNLNKTEAHGNNLLSLTASQIGAWRGNRGMKGHIDEFALYSTILTSQQIDSHFKAATSVPEPTSLAMFALGLMGLASRRFKKKP